jgi:hypothetical protein
MSFPADGCSGAFTESRVASQHKGSEPALGSPAWGHAPWRCESMDPSPLFTS